MLETIQGRGVPPSVVLTYIAGLPDTSLYHAELFGGNEHRGWGQDRHLIADVFDAIRWLAIVHGEKSDITDVSFPRPGTKEAEPTPQKQRMTLKDAWARINGKK